MAATPEQRTGNIKYKLEFLATKAELEALCREVRATRWTIVAVGVGISIVILATRFIG